MLKTFKITLFLSSLALLSWQLLTPTPEIQAGGNDKIYHMAGFAWLSLTAHLAFHEKVTYWAAIASALCTYGLFTETLQHFIPGRSFSLLDWLADCSGVLLLYPLIAMAIRLVRPSFRLS